MYQILDRDVLHCESGLKSRRWYHSPSIRRDSVAKCWPPSRTTIKSIVEIEDERPTTWIRIIVTRRQFPEWRRSRVENLTKKKKWILLVNFFSFSFHFFKFPRLLIGGFRRLKSDLRRLTWRRKNGDKKLFKRLLNLGRLIFRTIVRETKGSFLW